ncbi:MAG TPA: hypothetical protein VHR45_17250 [Thermoanaerobaculia bacterium]|nr:hypothetical protein [Thermoanaerobaculia bacterium]
MVFGCNRMTPATPATSRSNGAAPGGRWPAAVLLFVFLLWGWMFIRSTSFVVDGVRYYCLFDDAMISMTYARNLCEGYGLNWARQDEPVEGFTHPLWMLLMIPVNALPIALAKRSLVIQLFSLTLLALNVLAVRALALRCSWGTARHWLLAATLTTFYYPLNYWSLLGMETGLQALLTTLAVLLALDLVDRERRGVRRHLTLWMVLTAAYLLRMDMLLLAIAVEGYVAAEGGVRREERRRWMAGLAIFAGSALAYSLFRWLYFHDLLPNTYYLKLTGVATSVRLLRGLSSLRQYAAEHLAVVLAAAIVIATCARRQRRLLLPAAVAALYFGYSVYVGGDAWDSDLRAGRFVVFVMPLVFVLLNTGVNRLLAAWRARWPGPGGEQGRVGTRPPIDRVGTRPPQDRVGTRPADATRRRALETAVLAANLLLWLVLANGLLLSPRALGNRRDLALRWAPFAVVGHQIVLQEVRELRSFVAPGAVVATAWAGIPAYFTDYKMIDLLGYNDREVARLPSQMPYDRHNYDELRPGHNKWDPWAALAQRPDAFFQTWGLPLDRQSHIMRRHGYVQQGTFWLRADSDKVRLPPA